MCGRTLHYTLWEFPKDGGGKAEMRYINNQSTRALYTTPCPDWMLFSNFLDYYYKLYRYICNRFELFNKWFRRNPKYVGTRTRKKKRRKMFPLLLNYYYWRCTLSVSTCSRLFLIKCRISCSRLLLNCLCVVSDDKIANTWAPSKTYIAHWK